jgi:hypothetical protein
MDETTVMQLYVIDFRWPNKKCASSAFSLRTFSIHSIRVSALVSATPALSTRSAINVYWNRLCVCTSSVTCPGIQYLFLFSSRHNLSGETYSLQIYTYKPIDVGQEVRLRSILLLNIGLIFFIFFYFFSFFVHSCSLRIIRRKLTATDRFRKQLFSVIPILYILVCHLCLRYVQIVL